MSQPFNTSKKKSLEKHTVLIVVSRFNEAITTSLQQSAEKCLEQNGILPKHITVIEVPGALEIPIALKKGLANEQFSVAIVLGAVIRGATPHFDYVAKESIEGVMKVSLETNTVIPMGILTTNTAEQALERTGIKYTNKGWEVAQNAVDMIHTLGLDP